MIRVMVTGAGGFLGGALARRLAGRAEVELIALGRSAPPDLPDPAVIDLRDRDAIVRLLAEVRPDVVVNGAGRTTGAPDDLVADNAVATANLAEAIGAAAPAAGLVLLGSAAQYGRREGATPWKEHDPCTPVDAYGRSKQAAETAAFEAARRLGFGVTALRLFNIVAAAPLGEQVLAAFLRRAADAAAAGPPPWRVRMGSLGAVRDFVELDDVLTAVERVIERGVWGMAINVCSGVGRTPRSLLDAVAAQTGGAVVIEEAPATEAPRVAWSVGDPARCAALLGFRPAADLAPLTRRAAEWLISAARTAGSGETIDARSRA